MRRAVSKILPTPKLFNESYSTSNFKIDYHSIDDFYIQLDNPHKVWLPGEEVSGQIVLISKKNLANIVITLSLLGFIKINASSHLKLRPLKHTLFDHTIKIYGKDEDEELEDANDELKNGLLKGEHVFPFIVKLPNKRVFTSIDFGKGSINYTLKASIGNSSSYTTPVTPPLNDNASNGSFSKKKFLSNPSYISEKVISLVNPIDVSQLSKPKPKRLIIKDPRSTKLSRIQTSTSTINTMSSNEHDHSIMENHSTLEESSDHKSIKSTPVPTIKVILEVPQRGYLRGELIPLKLSINHLKKIQDFNGIIITLVRVCRLDNGPDGVVESFRKDLQQLILPLYVDPVTFQSEINSSVRVPADAFPTIVGCPLVSFQYFVEVLINLSGKSVVLDSDVETHSHANNSTNAKLDNFKFNYNSAQNERSSYINTDRFKRLKKFLQLTTEITIGTHRLTAVHQEHEDETMSARSSSMASNTNLSPAVFTSSSPSSPVEHQQAPAINAIPEAAVVDTFTPPYENVVPQYDFVANLQGQSELSEKERMRQLETSLLPSAPPDEEEGEEPHEVEHNASNHTPQNNNHFHHAPPAAQPQPPTQQAHTVSPVEVPSAHQFTFFTYQNGHSSPSQIQLEDELYQEPIDTAPNYMTVNNDRLIVPQDNNSTTDA
ncbi:pH-response regulator protein palF/RIM8 [Candida viswanathii]|uniref:pH-response regulator protein palF/RIM8 n=1 Tax=Candida viswanathii TaxID=5486 RepID=A0A367Y677_9ASCO|nr:pH-response regulator protein palF/RIM8 [Candida viswanathii]